MDFILMKCCLFPLLLISHSAFSQDYVPKTIEAVMVKATSASCHLSNLPLTQNDIEDMISNRAFWKEGTRNVPSDMIPDLLHKYVSYGIELGSAVKNKGAACEEAYIYVIDSLAKSKYD